MPISLVLVDDHEPFRRALRTLLDLDARFSVAGEANSGETAIALVERLAPEVVLMDLSMPGMGGVEATRRITEQHPSVHVIGLSLHDDPEHEAALLAAGGRCLVSKHGDAEAIWCAVLAWAGPQQPADAVSRPEDASDSA